MARPATRPMVEHHGRKFYRDERGYYVASPLSGESTTKLAHRWIWEHEVCPIPDGWVVHHINHDPSDNRIENLIPMPGALHMQYHASIDGHRDLAAENIRKHALPGWERWRRTEAGAKELRERMAATMERMNQAEETATCSHCGKQYQRKAWVWKRGVSFCNPNCQNSFRRKSGKDDVGRVCEVCGKAFRTHKRMGGRSCSKECKAELIRRGHLARQRT